MTSSVIAVSAWDMKQLTSTSGVSNADVAVDHNDVTHRVYERDSKIYYSNSNGTAESYIADGTNPAIAVGPNDKPQIVYISGGVGYYAYMSGNSWTVDSTVFDGANWVDIAVDSNNKAHIVYQANIDGDSYQEIYSASNQGGSMGITMIADGSYDSGSGNYYSNPSIFIDKDNYAYISYTTANWGGRASWSERSMYVYSTRTGFTRGGPGADWNAGIDSYKNSMGLDSDGNLHLIYNYQGTMVDAIITSTSWTQNALPISVRFGVSTKDNTLGLVYVSTGSIYYMAYGSSSWSAPEFIDSGDNPVVGLGSVNILYTKDNDLYEASTRVTAPPSGPSGDSVIIIPFSIVTGTVTYGNGSIVPGADVDVTCNNVTGTATTDLFGNYDVAFSSTDCKFGDPVSVTASKSPASGSNTGNMCAAGECEFPIGLVDVQIPEFGLIAASLAVVGALGIFMFKRK